MPKKNATNCNINPIQAKPLYFSSTFPVNTMGIQRSGTINDPHTDHHTVSQHSGVLASALQYVAGIPVAGAFLIATLTSAAVWFTNSQRQGYSALQLLYTIGMYFILLTSVAFMYVNVFFAVSKVQPFARLKATKGSSPDSSTTFDVRYDWSISTNFASSHTIEPTASHVERSTFDQFPFWDGNRVNQSSTLPSRTRSALKMRFSSELFVLIAGTV